MLTVVATVVLVLGGALASCSDGGGDQAAAAASGSRTAAAAGASTPAPTASASVAPSLSAEYQALKDAALAMEEPVPPEGMNENTPEGAALAAGYFIDLYPYVYATGDLTAWEEMSEDDCIFCTSVATNVTTLHSSGGWDSPWEQALTVTQAGVVPDDPTIVRIDLHIESGPMTEYAGDGSVVFSRNETIGEDIALEMHWDGQSWRVTEGQSQ